MKCAAFVSDVLDPVALRFPFEVPPVAAVVCVVG